MCVCGNPHFPISPPNLFSSARREAANRKEVRTMIGLSMEGETCDPLMVAFTPGSLRAVAGILESFAAGDAQLVHIAGALDVARVLRTIAETAGEAPEVVTARVTATLDDGSLMSDAGPWERS